MAQVAARREGALARRRHDPAGDPRTLGPGPQLTTCARSARTMSCVTALSACGRLSVTKPAAPRRSNKISGTTELGEGGLDLFLARDVAVRDLPPRLLDGRQ